MAKKKAGATPRRPENKQAITRALELLKLLPEHPPGKTVAELHDALEAAGYAVTQRSVQRDLNTLTGPFAITCDQDDTHQRTQRWYWMPDATTRIAAITQAESLALHLVAEFLEGLSHKSLLVPLEGRLRAARRFLTATNEKGGKTGWTLKLLSAPREFLLQEPEFDRKNLEILLDALFAERQVQILYESLNDKVASKGERWRTLHPYLLVFKGSVAYLAAREDGASDEPVKQFAVHRIRDIRSTTKPCVRKGFNFSEYREQQLHELGEKSEITLKLALRHATIEKVLGEAKISATQRMHKEGNVTIVEATVLDTNPLRRWLLAQGNRIEVLEPPALRRYVREQLESAAQYYALGEG